MEPESVAAEVGFRPGDGLLAVGERLAQSWENALMLRVMGQMLIGEASIHNLSVPTTI